MEHDLSRREFLKLLGAFFSSAVLAGCGPGIFTEPAVARTPATVPSRLRPLEKKDLVSYAHRIEEIFQTAYKVNSSNIWDKTTVSSLGQIKRSLNVSFANLSSDLQDSTNPLPMLIKAKAAELMLKPINRGKLLTSDENWIAYLKAIKELYEENGYTVESSLYSFPPTVAIYTRSKVEKYEINPFGLIDTQGLPQKQKAVYHLIESDKNDTVIDTYKFLIWQRFPAESYPFDGDHEIFVHKEQADINVAALRSVGLGQVFSSDRLNPPRRDTQAVDIRKSAQNIISTIKNLEETYYQGLKIHEEAHLLSEFRRPNTQKDAEERSYVAQLFAKDEAVAKLALASYLFNISTKISMDEAKKTSDYSTDNNLAGMQAAMADMVEAIYYIPKIEEKLGGFNGEKMRPIFSPSNRFLPKSQFTEGYTSHLLSNSYKLEGAEINKIARYIVYKHRNDWLPENTIPATAYAIDDPVYRNVYTGGKTDGERGDLTDRKIIFMQPLVPESSFQHV